MKLSMGMSAALAAAALSALTGCNQEVSKDGLHQGAEVGGIAARLTLPDDSSISAVSFSISGPGGYAKNGTVPTGSSTVLTFRVGGIPAAADYNIQLDADSQFGNHCTGNTDFDVQAGQTSIVNVVLVCGATTNTGDVVINGTFQSCPLVSAITALPAEITLGNAISLSSSISHGADPVHWAGAGGTFGSADAYDTTFTCTTAGTHTLTVAINTADCNDSETVAVTCTLGAGCGNGQLDPGEQCDDGNNDSADACTSSCQTAVCGDGFVRAGTEGCDDSNNLTEACDYGTQSCQVCNASCQLVGGAAHVCGDGAIDAVSGETCDDSNAATESCAYGAASCTVCDASCQSVAGATHRCGDGVVDAASGEACDGTAGCNASCQITVDTCTPCTNTNCTNYQGIDWVAGCFDSTATGAAARSAGGVSFTPSQVQACVDALACASANHCGRTGGAIANDCYCGSANLDDCNATGPAAGAPCVAQWQAATEQTSAAQVLLNISDISVPAGWAYFLLECQSSFCSTQCQ